MIIKRDAPYQAPLEAKLFRKATYTIYYELNFYVAIMALAILIWKHPVS